MTIVVSIVGLALLIFVHELGHFLASLALKMRPRRFYVGFPPALWKTNRGGIEYAIGAIPLGGFVKIPGMHRPAPVDAEVAFGRAVEERPSFDGDVTRLRESLGSGDHDAARDALGTLSERLDGATLSEPARKAADRGVEDIGDALGPDAYWRAATWKRVAVIAAGPLANILLTVVLLTGLFLTAEVSPTTRVDEVTASAPAGQMGLQPGDRIVSINGAPVDAETISTRIAGSRGQELTIVVQRNGETVALPPTAPRPVDGTYRLGFSLAGESLGPIAAVQESLRLTADVTGQIVASIGRLATGDGREDIASPVGIVQGSSDAAKQGAESFLYVLALISLSIALMNLLPLLPLDGGHIVFALAEGIRGRAVRREVYEKVSMVGIGLVVLLFFIGLSNDVDRVKS